jgi:hypothetical protein
MKSSAAVEEDLQDTMNGGANLTLSLLLLLLLLQLRLQSTSLSTVESRHQCAALMPSISMEQLQILLLLMVQQQRYP